MSVWSFFSNPDKWIRGHIRRAVKQAVFGDVIAEYKGEKGEKKVSRITDQVCANTTAVPIKNLCLPWPDGKTAQIDELIIADSGIYVIEVKNYKGWIFGNESNQYWIQVLSTGIRGESIKNKLYNPIRQNNSHIYCIKKNLKGYKGPIHSLIVFSNEAEFKDVTVNSSGVYVLYQRDFRRVMREINSAYKGSLSEEEIVDIRGKLILAASGANSSNHTMYVKQQIARKEERLEKSVCPRCGAPLVVRTAKKGPRAGSQFFGCSRYPDCRYTRNIK